MNLQFPVAALFKVTAAIGVLLASIRWAPICSGFDDRFSTLFFALCAGGALPLSILVPIVVMRRRTPPWRIANVELIALLLSSWLAFLMVIMHCRQMAGAAQWPGMAGIYLLPGSGVLGFLTSSLVATFLAFLMRGGRAPGGAVR